MTSKQKPPSLPGYVPVMKHKTLQQVTPIEDIADKEKVTQETVSETEPQTVSTDTSIPEVIVAQPEETSSVVTEATPNEPMSRMELVKLRATGYAASLHKFLDDFIIKLKNETPPGLTEASGARLFNEFHTTLLNIARIEDYEQFQQCWSVVLAYFNDYRDSAFNSLKIYQYQYAMTLAPSLILSSNNLINLALLTCSSDKETRDKGLSQVNIQKTLQGLTEQCMSNFRQYYNIR